MATNKAAAKGKASGARKVSSTEIIEALNNPKKGDTLIRELGWSKQQLVSEGTKLISKLAKSINDVNVV